MNKKENRYYINQNGDKINLEGHFVDYEGNYIDFEGEFLESFFHGKVTKDEPDLSIIEPKELIYSYGFPVKMSVIGSDGETYQYDCLDGKQLMGSRIRIKKEEVVK